MQNLSSLMPREIKAPIVFVVNDDQVLSGAVASLLKSVGYSVREFAGSSAVLEYPLAGKGDASSLMSDSKVTVDLIYGSEF